MYPGSLKELFCALILTETIVNDCRNFQLARRPEWILCR